MPSEDQPEKSKNPILRIIPLLISLILILIAMAFLKRCSEADPNLDKNDGKAVESRNLGAAKPIAQLLNPVPEHAGPFATKVADTGPVYYISTDPQTGKQTLNDQSGQEIYPLGDEKRRAWVAGFTDTRVLIFYTDRDTSLTHPKETWNTRQHHSVSPTSTKFGVGPIMHSQKTVDQIISSMTPQSRS